jgi:serine---pyruvate transaminase
MRKPRLMTPGPTPVLPEAALALGAPHPHHRTPEFKATVTRVRGKLRAICRTPDEVLLLTSSGTGAMEAALTNLTRPGDTVLVVDSGRFGHRWLDLCAAFGRRGVGVPTAAGRAVDPGAVGAALEEHDQATALCFAACESSTGVRADVQAVARAARRAAGERALLLVDAITELGAGPLETAAWDLDVVIGGSQKAFMVPPGLSFLTLSGRAAERLAATGGAGLYFNLARELKAQQEGSTSWTPATALIHALEAALDRMLADGLETIWAATERRARMTRAATVAMGMTLHAVAPAVSLTAVNAPPGIESGTIVAGLESGFGIRIAGGQGDLKGRIFRIAHLGWIDEVDTLGTLGALGVTLNRLGFAADTAAGLAAAAAIMAEAR